MQTQPTLLELIGGTQAIAGHELSELRRTGVLTAELEAKIKEKFLDVIAELIAHTAGWHYITVTALRELDGGVVIDVVTNGGFDFSKGTYEAASTKDATLLKDIEQIVRSFCEYER